MRISPEIESLIPYKPGRSIEEIKRQWGVSEVIKLDSNENPLGASPKALEAIQKYDGSLARYPNPGCPELLGKLSERWEVRIDDIVIGNGSSELIDLVIRVFCEPGDKIITPQKSFMSYGIASQAARIGKREIPIDKNFHWDVDQFVSDFKKNRNPREKILFVTNPNNPTGTCINKDQIRYLLSELGGRKDILVVFDEAYNGYIRAADCISGLQFFKEYSNVMVLRTFSKIFGLAGLRIGVLIANRDHTQWIHRVRNPFNVNSLAQVAASWALDDRDHIEASQKLVWQGLDDFYEFFKNQGIPYTESQGNFILFNSLRHGPLFFSRNLEKGLLIRPMDSYSMPHYFRISMGTERENKKAQEVLLETLKEVPAL